MTRREMLAGAAALAAAGPARAEGIAALAARARGSDEARTVFLHDAVRDGVAFGWGPAFNRETPAETLARRRGFCQTKGALLVALLAEAGVEARLVFAEIDARLLAPIIDPGTPWADHAFVEAKLGGGWLAFDSHVVQAPLMRAARARLAAAGRRFGWGAHAEGGSAFPGWSQFAADDVKGRVWGPFDGIDAFRRGAPKVWNDPPVLVRLGFGLIAAPANARADALAAEGAA